MNLAVVQLLQNTVFVTRNIKINEQQYNNDSTAIRESFSSSTQKIATFLL